MDCPKQFLTALGVHLRFGGYPNVDWRLKALQARLGDGFHEINVPFRGSEGFRRTRKIDKLVAVLQFLFAHIRVFVMYLQQNHRGVLYIPYPAVLLLWMMSFLPRRYRPSGILTDAFISIYDTVINDRRLIKSSSLLARLLKSIESRAYSTADCVIVDTGLSTAYFEQTFALPPEKILALPLSIDTDAYQFRPYTPQEGRCVVLFAGTFVPLQGTRTIVRAIKLLSGLPNIQFRLIGTGQDAADAEAILADSCGCVDWIKEWQSSDQLADAINHADICLGIFGEGEKTQRVWPLKNYSYMAVGRPVITGDTACARQLSSSVQCLPFITVPVGDSDKLAAAIVELASAPELRKKLATESRRFYVQHLSGEQSIDRICAVISDLNDDQDSDGGA